MKNDFEGRRKHLLGGSCPVEDCLEEEAIGKRNKGIRCPEVLADVLPHCSGDMDR